MNEQKDLAISRLDRLTDIIRDERVVRVDALSEELGVSAATIRRDLEVLEQRGDVRRVHGGAVSVERTYHEPGFDDKASMATREKHAIAEAALQRVQPNDTVFLDGGSTVMALARLLRDRTSLTVVTNSLRAAHELSARGPKVILIGGELRRRAQTFVGPLTRLMLNEINLDKAFMGTLGITAEAGMTTTDHGEAFTKELVMSRAREVYLLADGSKFGQALFARSGRLEQVDQIITDTTADEGVVTTLRKRGVKVLRAGK